MDKFVKIFLFHSLWAVSDRFWTCGETGFVHALSSHRIWRAGGRGAISTDPAPESPRLIHRVMRAGSPRDRTEAVRPGNSPLKDSRGKGCCKPPAADREQDHLLVATFGCLRTVSLCGVPLASLRHAAARRKTGRCPFPSSGVAFGKLRQGKGVQCFAQDAPL